MKANKVYQYFWAIAIILGFLACVELASDNNSIFDVNVHDTYFLIAHTHLYSGLSVLYFLLGLVYKLSGNSMNNKLTAVHTIITIGSFISYYILWAVTIAINNPEDILDNSMEIFNTGITLIFIIAVAAQPLILANIVISLMKSNSKQSA